MKVHENQVGLKLNWTHQLMVYADDIILPGDNNKQAEALTDASKEVGAEVYTEKFKYTLKYGHPNTGQNQNMQIVKDPLKM
jgi:hypothetical protein